MTINRSSLRATRRHLASDHEDELMLASQVAHSLGVRLEWRSEERLQVRGSREAVEEFLLVAQFMAAFDSSPALAA